MPAMNTESLLQLALDLAHFDHRPADSLIHQPGSRITHVLLTDEVDTGILFMARQLGYFAVAGYSYGGRHIPISPEDDLLTGHMAAHGVTGKSFQHFFTEMEWRFSHQNRLLAATTVPSVSQLLDMPYVTIHSPIDAIAAATLTEIIAGQSLYALKDTLIDMKRPLDARGRFQSLSSFFPLPDHDGIPDVPETEITPLVIPVPLTDYPAMDVLDLYMAAGHRAFVCTGISWEAIARWQKTATAGALFVISRADWLRLGFAPYIQTLRDRDIEVTALGDLASV